MSEPDISTLAKRLAEQNNVDWRHLAGTGPGGKVVERDVLDYLARVMAGEEAVDPTPEPLPEGMETWPDQDAPSYFRPAPAGARPEPGPEAPLAGASDAAGAPGGLLAGELLTHDQPDEPADHEEDQDDADGPLSDDIFLFDDDDDEADESAAPGSGALFLDGGATTAEPAPHDTPQTPWAPEPFAEPALGAHDAEVHSDDAPVAGTDHFLGGVAGTSSATTDQSPDHTPDHTPDYTPDYAAADATDDADDDALLVADDEERAADAFEEPYAATAPSLEPAPLDAGALFDQPLGGYSQEFTTPSEALESQGGADHRWGGDDLRLGDDAFEPADEEPASDLPDLWAGEGSAAAVTADDVLDLEQAETLDELDSLEDLEALDETPDAILGGAAYAEDDPAVAEVGEAAAGPTVAAPAAARSEVGGAGQTAGPLPLVRTGSVIRRHVDLSALAGAQLAAGLELGRDEPLTPAPFLLRAVAKAAAEAGGLKGQVALAELEGELRFRRVDAAADRPFAALVEELSGAGLEEDEIGLVAVDLSSFDLDEVLLDVDVPAVTLGRILYDTQRGAYRSTLTLSGNLPLERGAALLGRVAELLDAPVRLLL